MDDLSMASLNCNHAASLRRATGGFAGRMTGSSPFLVGVRDPGCDRQQALGAARPRDGAQPAASGLVIRQEAATLREEMERPTRDPSRMQRIGQRFVRLIGRAAGSLATSGLAEVGREIFFG
jgi:hypothetical protein